jgi:polyisoprenoid-binding protein YceI
MTMKNNNDKWSFLAAAVGVAAACAPAHAEPATYALDPGHSSVSWETLHMNTSSHHGRFQIKEGTVSVDKAAKTGKADVTIDMASLSGPVKSLEGSLRSERGFNVAAFPTARFVSDGFAFDNDNKVASVPGTLTLLGKSLPVTLQAVRFNCYTHPMIQRETCGGDFETTISRSGFGVNISPQGAADNVKLLIQVEAIRQE